MALWPGFCGGFYKALSTVIGADTAINVYTETRTVPGSAKQVTMYGTPGLVLDATVATLGCRGWFTQDGRTWVVVGATLYERTAAATYTSRGTIANDGFPVSFASNGQGGDQLGIVGGDTFYVLNLNTNALSTVTLPFSEPVMVKFLDGYGLLLQRDSPIVWFTALEDFTSVDALDFFTRSGTSDNLVGIEVVQDRIWCLGSTTTTLFYDSGDPDTPFLPYPGTAVQTGLASPWLLGRLGDVLYWVSEGEEGDRRVVRATDPQAATISTPPIAKWLATCSTLSTGQMLCYEQEGHGFAIVTCPDSSEAVQSYAFDAAENLWHARAGWDDQLGVYTRWRAQGAGAIEGTVFVGDYETGDLYTLGLDAFTDNGAIIRRERTTPYLSAENQWVFVDQFQLGMQSGVGLATGQGSAPVATLEISRDGARTWVNAGNGSLGAQGQYLDRAVWRKLGRALSGLLVFRVTQTDPVRTVWGPGAWIRLTGGTEQL